MHIISSARTNDVYRGLNNSVVTYLYLEDENNELSVK